MKPRLLPTSLGQRILLGFSALVLLFLGCMIAVEINGIPGTANQGKFSAYRTKAVDELELVSALLSERISDWFIERRLDIEGLAASPLLRETVEQEQSVSGNVLNDCLDAFILSHPGIDSVAILDPRSTAIRAASGTFREARRAADIGIDSAKMSRLSIPGYRETIELSRQADNTSRLRIVRQIFSVTASDRTIALLVAESDLDSALRRLIRHIGSRVFKDWEVIMASSFGGMVAQFRESGVAGAPEHRFSPSLMSYPPVALALSGIDAPYTGADWDGHIVLAFHRGIKVEREITLALVLFMEQAQALEPAWEDLYRQGILWGTLLVTGIALCIWLAGQISRPVKALVTVAARVASGELSARADVDEHTEIGRLASVFNDMVARIQTWHQDLEQQVSARTRELHELSLHLESLVTARTAELSAAKDAAEAANRAKSLFVASMSHELRTPLNAILGYAQLLARDPELSGSQRKSLETINRSGEYLLSMINDILDFSKIEAGKIELEPAAFDLPKMLEEIGKMFRARAAAKRLEFSLDIAPEIARFVSTDAGKLRQVLFNLLGNAIKFTEQGGIVLRAYTHYQAETLWLELEVEDSGPGISTEQQESVFEPFMQVDNTARPLSGTGLGLPISHSFVKLLGGEITLESTLGRGSLFRVGVPVAPASAETATRQQLGVGYQYQQAVVEPPPPTGDISAAEFASIPAEVREALYHAALSLDLDKFRAALEPLRDCNPSLAEGLAKLARKFHFERILELLEPYQGKQHASVRR